MSKEKIINLISDLHNTFGDQFTSPQQQQLLEQVKLHAHDLNEEDQATELNESITFLFEEISEEHPQAAVVLKQIIKTLADMGI